jgi:ribonuclease BN (tRNA processing enzyme)
VTADRNGKYFEEDALHVITTGTGAPLPDPNRVGPQAVVAAGDQMLVFDTGPGRTRQLALTGLSISSVSALFLTHYHSDHTSELGELMLQHGTGKGAGCARSTSCADETSFRSLRSAQFTSKARLYGDDCSLRPISHVKFLHDGTDIIADRTWGEMQAFGDRTIVQAFPN